MSGGGAESGLRWEPDTVNELETQISGVTRGYPGTLTNDNLPVTTCKTMIKHLFRN